MSSHGCMRGFHKRVKGAFILISEDGVTASRINPEEKFDQGLVFSGEPLVANVLFEVTFLSKVPSWSGSLEIGVTGTCPDELERVPGSSKELPPPTWTLMENSVLQNGQILKENYSSNLDSLEEGDTLGVLLSSSGEIIFFAKGTSLGPVPSLKITSQELYAFVNIYGKCASVRLTCNFAQDHRILLNDIANEAVASTSNPLNSLSTHRTFNNTTNSRILASEKHSGQVQFNVNNDKIRFHERKGLLIKLSNNNRTCERRRPLEEFNNGVVMTHRPLRDDELFEIRIDRLVDKWSGSIEVGMTAHNPNTLEFPSTMTNQRSGTLMMSGCGILTNGKGTKKGYGNFNLDELKEGDTIGMMRKTGGNLHFYINGEDQGVASGRVPSPIWGVVDLYGLTVKVTIVDRDERDDKNWITKRGLTSEEEKSSDDNNRLLFHTNCGSHAAVINNGTVAHRPNASEEFNYGVVLSNRPLLVNEIFEVRLDKMVTKWAGSIEIGVTTHSPSELDFPSTMTNIRSGTWMMTGNGVMHNGTTIIDDYGHNLDKLRIGDRVAVVRKESGILHFFVNSEDQGPAALNVPEKVYGVVDIYGQAAQVSILDVSDTRFTSESFPTHFKGSKITNELHCSNGSSIGDPINAAITSNSLHEQDQSLRFHHLHGRNARVSNNGLTASRPNALGEFNDAIVISNRPLKTGEHFEIVVERVVERWSGSIEVGVTLIRPEDLDFPNTMTDIHYDTWMLSGSAIMQDGQTVRNGYCCDLDSLSIGSRLGMLRALDGSLRYTINGEDQGVACDNVPPNVYAVIDLYGQCAQVSIVHNANSSLAQFIQPQITSQPRENSISSSIHMESSHVSLPIVISEDVTSRHKFDPCKVGKSLKLKNGDKSLSRIKGGTQEVLAIGSQFLENDDVFEVRIDEVDPMWAGSLKIGVTSSIEFSSSVTNISNLRGDTIYLDGCQVKRNGSVIKTNYCPSLDRMLFNDKIGVRRTGDGLLKFIMNSEESQTPIAATNLPAKVWPIIELSGSTMGVSIVVSSSRSNLALSPPFEHPSTMLPYASNVLQDSLEIANLDAERTCPSLLSFHRDNHGRNIQLSHGDVATRTDSYNQGIVVSNRSLHFDEIFGVHLRKVSSSRWSSSIMIGVLSSSPEQIHFPVSALGLKKNAWIISGNGVFQNGIKFAKIPTNLDDLKAEHTLGIQIRADYSLHLWINDIDQGPVIKQLPSHNFYYGLLDLYGKCEEVRLLGSVAKEEEEEEVSNSLSEEATKDKEESLQSTEEEKSMATFSDLRSLSYCEYLNACKRFKMSLGLPKHFFPSEEEGLPPCCFCAACCKAHGYCPVSKKGNPPKEYGIPQGWVRFPVRRGFRNDSEEALSSTRDWHVAYHPTKPAHIRKILDRGNLIPYDDLGLEQRTRESKSKEDDGGSPQFLYSPTLQYITHICSSTVYNDKKTRLSLEAKLALQLDVHPGSYKVGPPTAGALLSYDSHFKIEETEWLTKEKGNTRITGILISLET